MDVLYRLSYRSNGTGVDSQIRTDDIPGLQSGALDRLAMSTNSAGRQPECARRTLTPAVSCIKQYTVFGRGHRYRPGSDVSLQALSRRCPSLKGLPSLSGGERRSRSPAACATELLSREPWPLASSLSKTSYLAESGGLDPQPLLRPHRFRGGPGPCPVHSPIIWQRAG